VPAQGQKLLFKVTGIQTPGEQIRLVAVSDITKELDMSEVDAWITLGPADSAYTCFTLRLPA